MFLEVALPLPFTQSFYYAYPGEPLQQIQPGQRVLVPFRNQKLTAYVLTTHDRLPEDFPKDLKLKQVLEVLDANSLISAVLFNLSCWVANYYFTSPGEVFKACLPPKINPKIQQCFNLTSAGEHFLKRLKHTLESQYRKGQLLKLISQHAGVDHQRLQKLAKRKISTAEIRELTNHNYLRIEHTPKLQVSTKNQWHVSLHPNYQKSLLSTKLTHKQKALIVQLEKNGGTTKLSNLARLFLVSRLSLKRLEQKNILALNQETVSRNPFEASDHSLDVLRPVISSDQKEVLLPLMQALNSHRFSPFLLHGITGSGKTEVYLNLIENAVQQEKTALVLMPEIGLTPRIAQIFRARLGEIVAILHSGLSLGERYDEWWRIKRGAARVVIGTRSAVFAPLENLGLIVVDEEHDPSYKQQDSPRYHGRDTALVLGKKNQAVVVLGSATPSIESFHHSQTGKYGYLSLPTRIHSRPLPKVHLVDMREDFKATEKRSPLSQSLRLAIDHRLKRKEQVLIFLNRRGYSAYVLCRSCGQSIQCKYCSITLTFHKLQKALICHYCSYSRTIPRKCPHCSKAYLYFIGEGTEKMESLLQKTFPEARVARLDRDVTRRKDAHREILQRFRQRKIDILTGTQMISKGHDFPHVTLVGVISADHALSFPDFRAAERTFQLLTQVSGRAGRGELPGEVFIQSYFPQHYCFQFVTSHDYHGFYKKESRFRRFMHYPPFTTLAVILVKGKNIDLAAENIGRFTRFLQRSPNSEIRILGPTQSPLAMIRSEYRFQVLVKAKSRSKLQLLLQKALCAAQQASLDLRNIHIDIDPVNVM